jgi:long-chain-fatty-acid---luciferin-component ligase
MKNSSIETLSMIDNSILLSKDAYFPNFNERETVQKSLLLNSFQYHVAHNNEYRAYCERRNITLNDVQTDIRKIPLIPSTIFKSMRIRTDSGEETIKYCESSGTQGSVSIIERDTTTMERFIGTIKNANQNIFRLKKSVIVGLTPPPSQAKDLWIAHVISLYSHFYTTYFYMDNGEFKFDKLVQDLRQFSENFEEICFIGAPIMYIQMLKHLQTNNIQFDFGNKIFMITGGGWKRFESQSISRDEFKRECGRHFSGLSGDKIRDVFNMTELNTLIPECECGSKHIPVWLDVFPIDLNTYTVAKDGTAGLLGFLDALPASYPGFVVSGDVGRITYIDNCPCGRKGRCVEIIRRINTVETRGCALKIEKNYIKA